MVHCFLSGCTFLVLHENIDVIENGAQSIKATYRGHVYENGVVRREADKQKIQIVNRQESIAASVDGLPKAFIPSQSPVPDQSDPERLYPAVKLSMYKPRCMSYRFRLFWGIGLWLRRI